MEECDSHLIEFVAGVVFLGAATIQVCDKPRSENEVWSIVFTIVGSGLWIWASAVMLHVNECYGDSL
jgi:hypothetical protein